MKWWSKFGGFRHSMTSEEKLKTLEEKAECLEKRADNAEKEAGLRTRIAGANERIKASKAKSTIWSGGTIRIVVVLIGIAVIVLLMAKTC